MVSGIDRIESLHTHLFRSRPLLIRAPGRINLIGEHTDYNDGFVMPGAIDKEIHFSLTFSEDDNSTIHSIDRDESVTVGKFQKGAGPDWFNYFAGVVFRLREKGYDVKPVQCVFGGNIPVGSGLSSSAALECGFIYGLNKLHSFGLSPLEMVEIAQWAEHNFAGVRCGIMDQFSSMMGKKDRVFILDCRTLEFHYLPLVLGDCEIVLLDSCVKHSLASSEYNVRRSECEEGVRRLRAVMPEVKNLRDITSATVKDNASLLPGTLYRRCLYVTMENERVQDAGAMLTKGDLTGFGRKMFDSHSGLSRDYEVSCEELDFLVNEAAACVDVLGSRMMGGGFGGCTINLVRSQGRDQFVECTSEVYRKKFGIDLIPYAVNICDGAGELVSLGE